MHYTQGNLQMPTLFEPIEYFHFEVSTASNLYTNIVMQIASEIFALSVRAVHDFCLNDNIVTSMSVENR